MSEVKYSKEHEWIKLEGNTATIGITEHAQNELGDIVFVELPELEGRKKLVGYDIESIISFEGH